jgi:hypothetical protein
MDGRGTGRRQQERPLEAILHIGACIRLKGFAHIDLVQLAAGIAETEIEGKPGIADDRRIRPDAFSGFEFLAADDGAASLREGHQHLHDARLERLPAGGRASADGTEARPVRPSGMAPCGRD